MMGACMRTGVKLGAAMSALVVAIPACLMLLWAAMGCMWVVGLVSVTKLLWKLGGGGGDSKWQEEAKTKRSKTKVELVEELEDEEKSAEMRLSLFHQYLEDQLNTLAHQLLHVYSSDSMPSSHVDFPLHMDVCNWAAPEDEE